MIRIKKPRKAPKILTDKGEKEKLAMCQSYENGARDFEFDAKIYGDKTVKEALRKVQHDKCFLCESKIGHISYGDVEHFRPKKAFCQTKKDKLTKPGYYWLAYEWENLFLACQLCNQRFKKNLFPIENQSNRAVSHASDLSKEKPLFLNPVEENPEDFISFRIDKFVGVLPYAVNGNPKGKTTIEGSGIDRQKLCDMRMEKLKPILALYKVASMNLPQPESDEARLELRKLLDDFTKDSAEYAGMFRAFKAILQI